MKKIGIVTFQRALNYGALLQMYALHEFILENFDSHQVEVVDYFSPLCEKECTLKNIKGSNIVVRTLKKVNFLLKNHQFEDFIRKHINISRKYDIHTIRNAENEYDVLVSGSDQVWNPAIIDGDMNYLLQFSEKSIKVSYAASIGKTELPLEYRELYKNQLEKFKKISVRERSAKTLVDDLLGRNHADVNVDPTLLLSSESWSKLADEKKNCRYVMVYQVKYSKELLDKAKEFAANKGLKVMYVGPYAREKGIHYIPAPSVNALLGLFKNADYVFTNSFHGTVFSIQFKRKFFVDLLFSDGRNDRITDLLAVCNLSSCMDQSLIEQDLDWEYVREQLEKERSRSLNYLQTAIKDEIV